MNLTQYHSLFAATAPVLTEPDTASKPGHKFFGRFFVKVSHPAGSIRSGVSPTGEPWATQMKNDYGELPGSKGTDGDPIDVYLGPHPESGLVHVVHMNDADGNYDEDKSFLGFKSQQSVVDAFKDHYPGGTSTIGAITTHRVKDFRRKVRLSKQSPVKLHASAI